MNVHYKLYIVIKVFEDNRSCPTLVILVLYLETFSEFIWAILQLNL